MKMTPAHHAALADLLRWRRDVRHFRPDPVPEALLESLRAAMDTAPSVGNARPWRVLRVASPEIRQSLRDAFTEANARAAEIYDDTTREAYQKLKLAGLDIAPEVLVVFTETAPDAGRGLGRQTMPETLMQSTSMAIFSLWLTARAHDLGVGMLSILDPARIEALFDVPKSWQFSACLCIGYPAFEDDTPLLHREGWQANQPTDWDIR